MSLPDTVFIFVLALIIFGPKKLPEIGRQIGKLVGEFRRASNEFKFQIEEELRQVDFNEKRVDRQTIAPPQDNATQSDPGQESDLPIASSASLNGMENLPAGQHPNIDNLDLSALDPVDSDMENMEPVPANDSGEVAASPAPPPTVKAAAGSEPRTTVPYANAQPTAVDELPGPVQAVTMPSQRNPSQKMPNQEEASNHTDSMPAEVTRG